MEKRFGVLAIITGGMLFIAGSFLTYGFFSTPVFFSYEFIPMSKKLFHMAVSLLGIILVAYGISLVRAHHYTRNVKR